MEHAELLLRFVYLPLAAITGALSSLGARRWRQMSRGQIAFTILTGVSFALFVTPAVVAHDSPKLTAMTYFFSFGAHILLPAAVKKLERWFGLEGFE